MHWLLRGAPSRHPAHGSMGSLVGGSNGDGEAQGGLIASRAD